MFFVLLYFCLILSVHQLVGFSFSEEKRKNAETIICFLLLYLFFGFRDLTILNDTAHYYSHFEDAIALIHSKNSVFEIDRFDRFEPGFLVFENILATITQHPYVIVNLSALIVTGGFVFVISRNSDNIGLICFLLLGTTLLNTYSGVRQGIACSIAILGIMNFVNKKHFICVSLFLFASLFHTTAFFVLLLLYASKLKVNKLTVSVFVFVILYFSSNLLALRGLFGQDDSYYFETSMSRDTLPLASILNFGVSVLFLLSTYFMNKKNQKKWDVVYWWIAILNCVFLFLDITVQGVSRFSLYLYLYTIIFWWKNVLALDSQFHKLNIKAIFIFLILLKMFVSFEYRPEWYHIIPYKTYDFSQKVHDTNLGY